MKYSQACQVKAIVDKAIASLEKNAQEGKVTVAGKKWLVAAYVSGPRIVFVMVPLTLREAKQGESGILGRHDVLGLECRRHRLGRG